MTTRETMILNSVEAPDSAWWGYAHAEPRNHGAHPPLDQMIPTHVALRGAVPPYLMAQAVALRPGDNCPCCAEPPVVCVPVDAQWPAGTQMRWRSLGSFADAYADAG